MSQITKIGEAELTSYAMVERKNGTVEYYSIKNGESIEISEAEYFAETKEK